jgi:hypothetical protein
MHGTEQEGRTRSEVKMSYFQLKIYMAMYHRGEIFKMEMALAIGLWQEAGAKL